MRLVSCRKVSAIAGLLLLSTFSSVFAEGAAENYQAFCSICHGATGGGDGPGAVTLPVKPRKFTDCDRMRQTSDEEALAVINNGGAASGLSRDMPAWKDSFSASEIRSLLRYVKSFCKENQAKK